MKILEAMFKFAARKANDKLTSQNHKHAQSKAYKETGKQMRKANREGKYINGSRVYKVNFNQAKRRALKNGRAREQFINDL